MTTKGWLIDPDTGERCPVSVGIQGANLRLDTPRGPKCINPARLRPMQRRGSTEIYSMLGETGFRLGLTEIGDRLVEARLPAFPPPRAGGIGSPLLLVLLIAVAAAVAAILAV